MAARVAVIGLQLALVAWTQRNRVVVGATFRSLAARLYGRQLKPWQLRAYRNAALAVLALTVAHDVLFVLEAS